MLPCATRAAGSRRTTAWPARWRRRGLQRFGGRRREDRHEGIPRQGGVPPGLRADLRADERDSGGRAEAARRPRAAPLRHHRPGPGVQRDGRSRGRRGQRAVPPVDLGTGRLGPRHHDADGERRRQPLLPGQGERAPGDRIRQGQARRPSADAAAARAGDEPHPPRLPGLVEEERARSPAGLAMRSLLRNVDASWLRMDDPENLMVVTGVLVLDAPVPVDRIRALLERRLLRFRRFTSRVVPPVAGLGVPSWEPDPDFSLDRHLRVVRLGPGAGEPALQAFVSGLLSEPFPEGRPLWTLHFIEHFRGGSALVARIHHCIGDGLALVHVLLSMADGMPEPESRRARPSASWGITLGRRVVEGAAAVLDRPGRIGDLARLASSSTSSLLGLLALPADPETPLKGSLSVKKTAAW